MNSQFLISLHLKTQSGFETFGSFDLGPDKQKATAIYSQLKGTPEIGTHTILYLDFSEIRDGIPLPIDILHCTLDEIACNVKIITRDIFKNLSL